MLIKGPMFAASMLVFSSFLAVWAQTTPTYLGKGAVYNVRDYGAKGDGSADDASALQAAVTDAIAAGGVVYLPPGRYLVGSTIGSAAVTSAGFRLLGAGYGIGSGGTRVVVKPGFTGDVLRFQSQLSSGNPPRSNAEIAFLDISCGGNDATGLHLADLDGNYYHDIQITDCKRAGFRFDNLAAWSEENRTSNLKSLNNSIGFWFTTSGNQRTSSYGYSVFDFYCELDGPNQACVQGEASSSVYNGEMSIRANVNNSSGTSLLRLTNSNPYWGNEVWNLQWEGLPGAVIDGAGQAYGVWNISPVNSGSLPSGFVPPRESIVTLHSTYTDGAKGLFGNPNYTGKYLIFTTEGHDSQGIVCYNDDTQAYGDTPCSVFIDPANKYHTGVFQVQDYAGSRNVPYLRIDQSPPQVTLRGSLKVNNGATVSSGSGAPSGACTNGSTYSNTSGAAGSTWYVCISGSWVAEF